ncbi:hypothetical protein BT63DRAFT_449963 [Microthyrium microscopicum]|uniref:Uncharacterized protein n=1 Tax=Microthyrium microscopicum TaxID=703497 RepID=A0A6A6UU53_9PEZI|nr:hypothetical protein BT63DRAFT_449963 [Microthyrium microscopicum]
MRPAFNCQLAVSSTLQATSDPTEWILRSIAVARKLGPAFNNLLVQCPRCCDDPPYECMSLWESMIRFYEPSGTQITAIGAKRALNINYLLVVRGSMTDDLPTSRFWVIRLI